MLDHQLQTSRSKAQRFLVKPITIPLSKPKTKSIFSLEKQHQTKNLQHINNYESKVNTYQICGDQQFKKNYLQNLNKSQKTNSFNDQGRQVIASNEIFQIQKNGESSILQKKLKQSIYMNSYHNNNFLSNLNKTQKNTLNRENSSLKKFSEAQNKWQKIDNYLKLRIPKSQTVTFGSINKIYVHENPQKIEIINDMLPQYWQNSLRNNDKKLKSYLKGHKFNSQKAEQMLQTLKGINKIQKSIPKIGVQRIKNQIEKNISLNLKANKLKNTDGSQTMRQFHKSLHQTLKERSFRNSTSRRFSQSRIVKQNEKFDQDPYFLKKMKQDQKRVYLFCKDLEKLDRIDQQIYKKNYDEKSKWILEGLQIVN